jgi:predicted dienelactone hydrolase
VKELPPTQPAFIWYPSAAAVQPVVLGPTTMSVAVNGIAQGKALPLVVMSHGTGGSLLGHFDTAIALADAGVTDTMRRSVGVSPTGSSSDMRTSVDVDGPSFATRTR